MRTIAALIFENALPVTIGGMTLTERSLLLAHRAGLRPVGVWGSRTLDPNVAARLPSRGISVSRQPPDSAPLAGAADDQGIVIVGPNVLFEPAVLAALVGSRASGEAAAAYEAGAPLLLYVPPGAVTALRACKSIEAMASSLAALGILRELPMAGVFCRRVNAGDVALSLEQEYVRHLNGGESEAYFTKKIRRFSVPLTSRLVRLGAKPTHVTLGGLALAVASAWCLARGSYGAGLLGAILYYMSMIFDCSDGEVARLTARDSRFGAWLETIVDYLTYVLVLAALTVVSQGRSGAQVAAAVALVGSIVIIVVAGYLRHRVAAADPGQFDEASAHALASATRFHRFARWGRQWIKRSTVAHLIVALALINQLPVLLYLWAFGAAAASLVIVAVEPFVVRRVSVAPAGVRNVNAGG